MPQSLTSSVKRLLFTAAMSLCLFSAVPQTLVKEIPVRMDQKDTVAEFWTSGDWWGFAGAHREQENGSDRTVVTLYTGKAAYRGFRNTIEFLPGTGIPVFETRIPESDLTGSPETGESWITAEWVGERKTFEAPGVANPYRSPFTEAYAYSAVRSASGNVGEQPVRDRAEGKYLVYAGKDFGPFADIRETFFTGNGTTLFFSGMKKSDGNNEWYFYDGETLGGPYNSPAAPEMSPDGTSWYYSLVKGNATVVYTPGWKSGTLEYLQDFEFGTGGVFALVGKASGAWYVMTGSETAGPFAAATDIAFSPDGTSFAYGYMKNGRWYLSAGNETFGPYDRVSAPLYLKNGSLAYALFEGGKTWFRNGTEVSGPYAAIRELRLDPEGTAPVYEAFVDGSWYVVRGDEKYGPFDELYDYRTFEGNEYYFTARIGRDQYYCVGGERHGPYDRAAFESVFRNEGRLFQFRTKKADVEAVHAGGRELVFSADVNSIGFVDASADGKNFTWIERMKNRQTWVVFGDRRFGPYGNAHSSLISPDGQIIGFSYTTEYGWALNNDAYHAVLYLDGELVPGKFIMNENHEITGYVAYRNGNVQTYRY